MTGYLSAPIPNLSSKPRVLLGPCTSPSDAPSCQELPSGFTLFDLKITVIGASSEEMFFPLIKAHFNSRSNARGRTWQLADASLNMVLYSFFIKRLL